MIKRENEWESNNIIDTSCKEHCDNYKIIINYCHILLHIIVYYYCLYYCLYLKSYLCAFIFTLIIHCINYVSVFGFGNSAAP